MKKSNPKEKISNISNFIGVYDNYVIPQECKKAIKLFEDQQKFNNTMDRISFENSSILEKKDRQYFAKTNEFGVWFNHLKPLLFNFDMALKDYITKTGIKKSYDNKDFHYTEIKIQKTLPTEGYHLWHIEHGEGYEQEPRVLVYTIYLNDVEEGGETEFLHFSKRIKPKTGRIVIWPAAFPYVHRGNPPLSGKKYILTSWLKIRP